MSATEFDRMIGDRITELRGTKLSQQALADKMRERGFRWNQATAWSVERGDRPLKFAEAEALAQLFHLQTMDELKPSSAREDYQRLMSAIDGVRDAFAEALISIGNLRRAQDFLDDALSDAGPDEEERLRDLILSAVRLTPESLVNENLGLPLQDDGKHPEAS